MKLRSVIPVVLFSLCLLPFAEAKRPKKGKTKDLAKTTSMVMPDLQSVLGSAYQSPLELSDRAIPGAVIEVTDFGYRPIINDCVGEAPVESAFTNITMQSSLSGGVSFGIGGQGASVSGSTSVGLKFISPYILGFEMIRFKPSEKCRSELEDYGNQHGLSNLMVVQEALFARINGCSEIAVSVEGKVKAIGGAAASSASCQLFSNAPVAVGVRLVPVASFLRSQKSVKREAVVEEATPTPVPVAVNVPSVEVVEAQVEGLSGDLATRLAQLEKQRLAMEEAEKSRLADEELQRLEHERLKRERQAELERQRLEREKIEAELERAKLEAQRPYQEKASADWAKVKVFAEKGDDFGKEALEAFISEYRNVRLSISGQSFSVVIPEVAKAEKLLLMGQYEGFETVVVPGGTFMMGCLPSDIECSYGETPRHEIVISHDMLVMSTEVTQGLYESVMGSNPSQFKDTNRPVETVSLYDAAVFANALSRKEGLSDCYWISRANVSLIDVNCRGWRLPTEAEWEYLARGGEEHLYSGSDSIGDVAWYEDNSGSNTHPVGQKQANGFGLYDMSGNVWEWTWDRYGEYSSGSMTDPRGPSSGSVRIIRGGSWSLNAGYSRTSCRNGSSIYQSGDNLGFRLVRNP